jgi:hypothetical protein
MTCPQPIPYNVEKAKFLSVFNLNQLLQQKLRKIPLLELTAGGCGGINRSLTSELLAFLPNFSQINVIPVPHLNVISMYGMGVKQDYIIWR